MWLLSGRSLMHRSTETITFICKSCTRNLYLNIKNECTSASKNKLKTSISNIHLLKRNIYISGIRNVKVKTVKTDKVNHLGKVNKSEVKRLLLLMKPEKWPLASECYYLSLYDKIRAIPI